MLNTSYNQKLKIQIIGGSGYYGRSLSNYLFDIGHHVISYGRKCPENTNCEFVAHELLVDQIAIEKNVDILIYLAQATNYRDYPSNFETLSFINTILPVKYAIAADKKGVKQFFYSSTGNVYKPSKKALHETSELYANSPYSISKLAGEQYLSFLDLEMNISCLRIFGLFGRGQKKMLPAALRNRVETGMPIILNQKNKKDKDPQGMQISFLYIEDAVKILSTLCDISMHDVKLPKAINIAGNRAVSIREFSLLLGKTLRRDVNFQISNDYLTHNLIADITMLNNLISPRYTNLKKSIAEVACV